MRTDGTDYQPLACSDCGEWRYSSTSPCENPYCEMKTEMPRSSQSTWPPKSPERRIGKPRPVVFYVLREWDGGADTIHRPNGFMVQDKKLADEWKKTGGVGVDYITYEGVMVQRLEDIPGAKDIIARQKALNKLTDKEKELLGLK